MKPTRTLAIGLAALAALAVIAQDTFTLKRVFTEGEVDRYEIATSVQQTVDTSAFGGPAQEMNIESTMKLEYTTGKVDAEKGTAQMKIRAYDVATKLEGAMAEAMGAEMPKEYTVTGVMNAYNQMSDIKVEGVPAAMQAMMGQQMAQQFNTLSFPKTPVAVGQSWKLEYPEGDAMKGMTPDITATLAGVKEWEGRQALDIKVEGTVALEMPMSAEAAGGMAMTIKGSVGVKGGIYVEVGTGRLLFADTSGDMAMRVELTDMGTSLPLTGRTTSVIKLVK